MALASQPGLVKAVPRRSIHSPILTINQQLQVSIHTVLHKKRVLTFLRDEGHEQNLWSRGIAAEVQVAVIIQTSICKVGLSLCSLMM